MGTMIVASICTRWGNILGTVWVLYYLLWYIGWGNILDSICVLYLLYCTRWGWILHSVCLVFTVLYRVRLNTSQCMSCIYCTVQGEAEYFSVHVLYLLYCPGWGWILHSVCFVFTVLYRVRLNTSQCAFCIYCTVQGEAEYFTVCVSVLYRVRLNTSQCVFCIYCTVQGKAEYFTVCVLYLLYCTGWGWILHSVCVCTVQGEAEYFTVCVSVLYRVRLNTSQCVLYLLYCTGWGWILHSICVCTVQGETPYIAVSLAWSSTVDNKYKNLIISVFNMNNHSDKEYYCMCFILPLHPWFIMYSYYISNNPILAIHKCKVRCR